MRSRSIVGVLAWFFAAACSSPSAPSSGAPTTNTVTIAISSIAATVDKGSIGAVYHISLQLKETGGQVGATISSFLFTIPRGAATFSTTYTPSTAQRVPAGGSLDLGPINIIEQGDASTSIASQVFVAVSFVDDRGHDGSASGTGPVTQAPTYTVNGLVTDGTSAPSGRMRDVLVEVIDGVNAGLQARTDTSGNYAIAGIAPGSLTLSASTMGYEPSTKQVNIAANTRVDFVLPRIAPTPSTSLIGTWTGTGVDSMGTIILTWTLGQTGSAVSGTVAMQAVDAPGSCNSCHRNKSGSFSGTLDGTTLSMTLFFPTGGAGDPTPACTATLTGTASNVAPDRLSVAYSGVDSCEPPAQNGTVVMTRSP